MEMGERAIRFNPLIQLPHESNSGNFHCHLGSLDSLGSYLYDTVKQRTTGVKL